MSIIDALKCDYCGKTADRTMKEEIFWSTLATLVDDGSARLKEDGIQHFCTINCVYSYVRHIVKSRIDAPELVP